MSLHKHSPEPEHLPDPALDSEPAERHEERVEHDLHAAKHPPHHPSHDAKHTARWLLGLIAGVVAYYAGMTVHEMSQQRNQHYRDAVALTGGSPERGRTLLRPYGCAGCHTIPGVAGANGLVGPPLAGIGRRMYVAGVLLNTPDNLVRWILDPKAVDAKTAMPDVGLTEAQARDVAAYLLTLQ